MLEIISFICGFCIMAIEITGVRMLTPYIGTSYIIWTSIIGNIMIFLALGYWYGGKYSDKKVSYKKLSMIIFLAGLTILAIGLFQYNIGMVIISKKIYSEIYKYPGGVIISSLMIPLILFGPISFLLGMVSPYVVKTAIIKKRINESLIGTTIGKFNAISTIGSIIGTYVTGFILIFYLKISSIFFVLTLLLFFSSIILVLQEKKEEFFQNANKLYIGFQIFFILLVLCIFLSCTNNISIINEKMPCNVKIIDFLRTKYQTIIIFEKGNFRFITNVIDGTFIQSVINLKNIDMLVASYLKQFYFFSKIPNQTNVLCLGSGGGIFPRIYFEKMFSINKEFKMDVVEIDPIMIDIAKKYFYFYENKNIKCYIDDARIFLNRIAIEKNKYYNIIFVDIYQENSGIPFQIITKEAFSKMKQVLSEDGIVVINVVSAIEGKKSQVYRAIYKTMQEVFPEVKAFRIEPKSTKEFQNIILVGFKSAINPSFIEDIKNNEIIQCSEIDNIKILVDDYAPLEKYTFSL